MTISYLNWVQARGGFSGEQYLNAVEYYDASGFTDGLDNFQDALAEGTFDELLNRIETESTDENGNYQDVYIGGELLDIASFTVQGDLSNGFDASQFEITTFQDVLFLHLSRNILNEEITYYDVISNPDGYIWVPFEQNAFHRFGDGFENTFKVVATDGDTEYVFQYVNGSFELVTDPTNAGSYNFDFDPSGIEEDEHVALDITPWTAFGNNIEDSTLIEDRQLYTLENGWQYLFPNLPEELDTNSEPVFGTGIGETIEAPINFRSEIFGSGGDDTIYSGPQNDTINGGMGLDTVSYIASPEAVAVNLDDGLARHGSASFDNQSEELVSIENVEGSAFGDILIGTFGANVLTGASGSDIIDGLGGVDTARFNGNMVDYAGASAADGGILVTHIQTGETDTLYNIEYFQFDDVTTDQFMNPLAQAPLIDGLGGTAGFGENVLPANDDGSTEEIDISSIFEDGLNFFGREFTSLWINNNGGVTFNGPRGTFTPEVITENNDNPEITPFFADVDTGGGSTIASPGGTSTGSNLVYYDFDTANDRFIVTWDDVGYYSSNTDLTNAFQLILTDQGNGDFDIQFRYENIDWTTGNASGGSGGLGGTPARAGFTASTGNPAAYFELPASGDEAGILALDEVAGNTGQVGIWEFDVRSGDVVNGDIPALPEQSLSGATTGDPHLVTLDGVDYDFHAAGEFVLLRATDGSDFEVQSRMTPVSGSDSLTVNQAIALRVGGSNVMLDAADDNPLSVNGTLTDIENFSSIMVGDDQIYRSNNIYTIVFAGADGVINDGDSQIEITVLDGRVDFLVTLNDDLAGNLEGLLGNGDGNQNNDVALADGTPLARPFVFEDLYGAYRADWRVDTEADSLFTYDSGESLSGFYLPNHPASIASIDDFPASEVATATTVLLEAGLVEGTANFNNALLDYLATEDASYIESALDAPAIIPQFLVGTAGSDTLSGGGSDDRVFGQAGDDQLSGGGGNDELAGSTGNDLVNGGDGNDNMGGGQGNDTMIGGSGDDTMGAGFGNDSLEGGEGDDGVFAGAGNDTLNGGAGNDNMAGSFGSDVVNGSTGNDNMGGGTGQDTISGGSGNDTAGGGEGDDRINGGDGNDFLAGGGRNDRIDGGAGNDHINGGQGNDTMTGGAGNDVFIFSEFTSGDVDRITDWTNGQDVFRLSASAIDNAPGTGLQGKLDALNATQVGNNVEANYNGHTIILQGALLDDLGMEDFIFV